MLRSLCNGKAVPLKYPQQETAISHRHAKTAVTGLHQGDTWKELLPVVWALPCFILSLPLSGFSQCPPLWSPFKRPPSLCNPTHTAVTYPLVFFNKGTVVWSTRAQSEKSLNLNWHWQLDIPFRPSTLPFKSHCEKAVAMCHLFMCLGRRWRQTVLNKQADSKEDCAALSPAACTLALTYSGISAGHRSVSGSAWVMSDD